MVLDAGAETTFAAEEGRCGAPSRAPGIEDDDMLEKEWGGGGEGLIYSTIYGRLVTRITGSSEASHVASL